TSSAPSVSRPLHGKRRRRQALDKPPATATIKERDDTDKRFGSGNSLLKVYLRKPSLGRVAVFASLYDNGNCKSTNM
ncbi:MAG: hypothetical protein KH299_04505, partial [Firmicutes bacterium]|nr:hypothetical protein [Bacillota bacterium]